MFDELRRRQPWLPEQRHWRESSFAFQLRALRDKSESERARYRQLAGASAYLNRAAKHCDLARIHCPWLPEPHLWSALTQHLQHSISANDATTSVDRATRLGQGRASIWYWAGVLQASAGEDAQAYAAWKRCAALSSGFDSAIYPWLDLGSSEPVVTDDVTSQTIHHLFDELLGGDPAVAERWIRMMARIDTPNAGTLSKKLTELALSSFDTSTSMTADQHASRARLLAVAGRATDSLAAWRECVDQAVHPPHCLAYARALIAAGDYEIARQQAARWAATGLDGRVLSTIKREIEDGLKSDK